MTTLNDLLAELRASATETQSYSYALDMDGEMSVHAALDRLHNPQRVQLTRKSEPHCAEVFWEQSEGYAQTRQQELAPADGCTVSGYAGSCHLDAGSR